MIYSVNGHVKQKSWLHARESPAQPKAGVLRDGGDGLIATLRILFNSLLFALNNFIVYGRMYLGQPGRIHVSSPQRQAIPFFMFTR